MSIKIWAYLGILVALLVSVGLAYKAVYKSGFNAAVVQQERLIQTAREEATEEARLKWKALVDAAKGQIIVEEKIVEVIREVEKEIPVVVEKVVRECRDLGPDVAGLLNKQIRSGYSGEANSTRVTPLSDSWLHTYARVQ